MHPGEAPPTHTRRGLIHMSRQAPDPDLPHPRMDAAFRPGGVRASHTGPSRPHFTRAAHPNPHKTPTGTHVSREKSALAMILIHGSWRWGTLGTPPHHAGRRPGRGRMRQTGAGAPSLQRVQAVGAGVPRASGANSIRPGGVRAAGAGVPDTGGRKQHTRAGRNRRIHARAGPASAHGPHAAARATDVKLGQGQPAPTARTPPQPKITEDRAAGIPPARPPPEPPPHPPAKPTAPP